MKSILLFVSALAIVCASNLAQAETVIASRILVSGHGGQFYADLVADYVKIKPDEQIYENLRLKTSYGQYYQLVEHELDRTMNLGNTLCAMLAPKGWYSQTYPYPSRRSSMKAQVAYLTSTSSATVGSRVEMSPYYIRWGLNCNSEPLPHLGE